MTDILSITDPQELRVTIDRNLHDNPFAFMAADATVDGVSRATAYARHNKHLLKDSYIAMAVGQAACDDDRPLGLPSVGEAVIVMSNTFTTDDYLNDEGYRRSAYPLQDDGGPAIRSEFDYCHRCDISPALARIVECPQQRIDKRFHIVGGRFVVEFALCADCVFFMETMYGEIVPAEPHNGAM